MPGDEKPAELVVPEAGVDEEEPVAVGSCIHVTVDPAAAGVGGVDGPTSDGDASQRSGASGGSRYRLLDPGLDIDPSVTAIGMRMRRGFKDASHGTFAPKWDAGYVTEEYLDSLPRTKRSLRRFYENQNELIVANKSVAEAFDKSSDPRECTAPLPVGESGDTPSEEYARLWVRISMGVNVALTVAKVFATISSGSLSVLASLIDSVLDVASVVIIWAVTRFASRRDADKYPAGKARLELIGVIILSAVMGMASLEVILTAINSLIAGNESLRVGPVVFIIIGATILVKFCLWIGCRRSSNIAVEALAQDHFNDVLTNSFGLLMATLGSQFHDSIDAVGAIVLACVIIWTWVDMARDHVKHLTGLTADQRFLQQLTYTMLTHDPRILGVDTVRAFHFGTNFIVEGHIVLPEDMPLSEAHDIGETLQFSLERYPNVDLAFVHLDVDCEHEFEHKDL